MMYLIVSHLYTSFLTDYTNVKPYCGFSFTDKEIYADYL